VKTRYGIPMLRVSVDLIDITDFKWSAEEMYQIPDVRGSVYLVTRIEVAEELRGQGLARQAVRTLLDDADAESVNLVLTCQPDGSHKSLTHSQLKAWYERLGFVQFQGDYPEMYRKPQVRNP